MCQRNIILRCVLIIYFGMAVLYGSQSKGDSSLEVSDKQNHNRDIYYDKFNGIRSKVHDVIKETGIASISLSVAKDGRIIWEEAFGWADREKRIKASPHTMYSLASISKPITATGLMILVERGLINLNQPVNKYLGRTKLIAYEGGDSDATVKRILQHTSGLPSHAHFFFENDPYSPPSMEETIFRYGILVTKPGEIFQYSNLGYGIIDHLISRISGKSYAEFMKTEVFIPLGMTRSSVGIGPRLEDYVATRYRPDQTPVPYYDFDHRGASAVISSAHDLVRFGMFHLKNHLPGQKQIITDSSIDAMQQETDPKRPDSRALGWRFLENDKGYHTVWHTGGMVGVRNILKLVPSENIAVAVLCNSKNDIVLRIADEIIAVVLPKFGSEPPTQEKIFSEKSNENFSLPQDLLGEWIGHIHTYRDKMPIKMLVQKDGDVHIKLDEQMETLMNDVSFDDGILSGRFCGKIKTEDASRFPHYISLKIKLRGKRMSGSASARASNRYALASYINLRKK